MLLFITRKYPPSVGGMQRLSYHLTTRIAAREPTTIIAWGGSQIWLPLFLPYAGLKALWQCARESVDLIHLSDLLLAPLGWLLGRLTARPVTANAHGLDVIYPNAVYQAFVIPCARRLDFIICNSEHTRRQCLAKGIAAGHTAVIPLGIDAESFRISLDAPEHRSWLVRHGIDGSSPRILLTVGRLVPRKGVRWFVAEVLPRLAERRDDWTYLVIGAGPERQAIIEAAKRNVQVASRVHLLGEVSDEDLRIAYAAADLFLMPNLSIPGDSEGFGIVHLEARAAGLPVIAADTEGIAESFLQGEDGWLLPAGNTNAFLTAIESALQARVSAEDRMHRAARIAAQYDWPQIIERYRTVFRDIRALRNTS